MRVSTELIVVRTFMGDQAVAEEMLAHGFAPELMTTREGRKVAETLLALRKDGTVPSLEDLRRALDQRGRLGGGFKRYLLGLKRTPCCSRLHAVAHLQMLKLDQAMARLDNVCERIAAQVGEDGATERSPHQGPAQVAAPEPVRSTSRDWPRERKGTAAGGSYPPSARRGVEKFEGVIERGDENG